MKDGPEPLPEYRVTLQEVDPAAPTSQLEYPDNLGSRTKFGGKPDQYQGHEIPKCPECRKEMSFVGQIDSFHHEWHTNPTARAISEQAFMFGDVGMLHVWFCFDCLSPLATFECF